MLLRPILSFAIVLGLYLTLSTVTFADDTHGGKVVSTTEASGSSDGKLVMTDKDGKGEHSHAISSTTKVTRDGKTVKLGELKKGDMITVTTAGDGKVTAVSATTSKSADSGSKDKSKDKSNLPDLLQNLKLSSDQRKRIDDIVKKYDDECEATWKEFADDYQQAIRIEASMLAAIEEHFNDAQRKHVRDQRQRTARHRKQDVGNRKQDAENRQQDADNRKQDEGKPKTKVDANEPEEEIVIIGITLTPQQQEKADGIRRRFNDRLESLNDNIQRLQGRMISLEAEKLLDIEEVLTKEQRDQLRREHEKLPANAEVSSDQAATK